MSIPVGQQADLKAAADKRVRTLAEMGTDGRLFKLAQMYEVIDQLKDAIETAIFAVERAELAVERGGQLIGGEDDEHDDTLCDCVHHSEPRTCLLAVLQVGGTKPLLSPKHPMLKCSLIHARAIEKALNLRMSTLGKLATIHQTSGNMLKAIGV
jgi:hypothetical protein